MVRRVPSARDVLDVTSFHAARALLAATALGVFEALSGRRATPSAVARRLGTDPEATERLLRVLLGMRLLEREGRRLRLAPGVRDLLTDEGEHSLSALLRHRAGRFRAWAALEESVRSGRPAVLTGESSDDPAALLAARARRDSARRWAPVLSNAVDLDGRRTLLLLGDGPAVFAYHFARANPRLQITVMDSPAAVAVGEEFLRGKPEAKRIRLVSGNLFETPIPSGRYEAAFLADALHAHSLEVGRRLLRRVRKALRPGARLFVRDRFLDDRRVAPLENALYDLQLLLTTAEGRCHPAREATNAVRAAGFRRVAVRDPGLGDDSRIVVAEV